MRLILFILLLQMSSALGTDTLKLGGFDIIADSVLKGKKTRKFDVDSVRFKVSYRSVISDAIHRYQSGFSGSKCKIFTSRYFAFIIEDSTGFLAKHVQENSSGSKNISDVTVFYNYHIRFKGSKNPISYFCYKLGDKLLFVDTGPFLTFYAVQYNGIDLKVVYKPEDMKDLVP